MNPIRPMLLLATLAAFFSQTLAAEILEAAPADFFLQKVYPLLQSKCLGCHGEDKQNIEGELDMSSRENLLKGGESGQPALVPGDPEKSQMFQAVLRTGKLKMPPKDRNKLATEEIEILRQWILSGAVWAQPSTRASTQTQWSYKEEDIWAFRPIKQVAVPEVRSEKFEVRNAVDVFLQDKLNKAGLQFAPPADKLTLIRRATFDLTGLPPTPKEIDDFTKDKSPDAFDNLIERLIASPRYGEKMARHWLDVVRYADTDGYSNDYERPNAWRYRDYVIRAFNSDKPYDQFVIEQIAGDECLPTATNDPTEREKLIAVGMLRMGPWEQTAMSVAAVTRQLFLDDVTAQMGAVYLGLTTGCARCHDHKFDPIPTKDYYRLQSCFASTEFAAPEVAFLAEENTKNFDKETTRVEGAISNLNSRIREITSKHDRAVKEFLKEKGYKALKDVPLKERPSKNLGLTSADASVEKTLRKRIEYCERELQRFKALGFSVSSKATKTNQSDTPVVHILVGGALESPGETVTPGLLSAVYNSDDAKNPTDWNTIPTSSEGRRLKLARWIASPDNPLTARVMVNRIWQWHFGKGIVESPNNFGKMGKRPTHPELLDWLANYFIEHGWSVKEMHRLIMRSKAYQQDANHSRADALSPRGTRGERAGETGSQKKETPLPGPLLTPPSRREGETTKNPTAVDPENKLLWHFPPRRMTAEELRDSMLFVSGDLNFEMGGPPIFPEINLEAALQPRHIMGSLAPVYVPSPTREQRNRRTIYTVQVRSLINPMLQVFNAAPTELSCERRDETTVTPQAFALFNSQYAHDAALAMAARLTSMTKSRTKQIEQAFLLAYGRKPDDREKKLCLKHLERMMEHHRNASPADFKMPKEIVREMVEEFTGEPFQFKEEWDMSNYEYNLQPSQVSAETRALADLCLVILNSNEFVYIY